MRKKLLAMLLASMFAANAWAENKTINIAPQDMPAALHSLASQTGIQLLFTDEDMKGIQAKAISGSMSAEDALARLLEGTNYTFTASGSGTYVIKAMPAPVSKEETELPVVEVRGAAPGALGYRAKKASTATKTNIPIMETPFSVQAVPQQLMEDQQALTFDQALKNVSGAYTFNAAENLVGSAITTLRGFSVTDYYRDGIPVPASSYPARKETANIEKIEVLKGPGSILFGRVDPGGVINAITKQPSAAPYYSFQQQLGTFNLKRTTIDATGPIGNGNDVLYRMNFAYHDTGSFVDFEGDKHIFLAPVLRWNVNNDTQVNFSAEYLKDKKTPTYGVPAIGTSNRPAPVSINFTKLDPWNKVDSESLQLGFNLAHRLSEQWKLDFQLTSFQNKEDRLLNYGAFVNPTTNMLRRGISASGDDIKNSFASLNLTGKVEAIEAWQLSEQQRNVLARETKASKVIHAHDNKVSPEPPTAKRAESSIVEARLSVLNNLPVWQVGDERGRRYAISALNGDVQKISADMALQIARSWGGASTSPQLLETVEKDLFTRMMMFDPYRPFHKVALGDGSGTELDISSRTGDVVVSTTRVQRVLAYTGEWLHYFRFLDSFGLGDQRRGILTWTSFIACVAVLTGLTVGWLRWRPGWFGGRTYANGRKQPYREPWPRWHFWLGLVGGIITLTWMVSGFLVNNPWEIFSKAMFTQEELMRFQGGALPAEALTVRPEIFLAGKSRIVELDLHTVGRRHFSLAYDAEGVSHPIVKNEPGGDKENALLDGAKRLYPNANIREFMVLSDYDDYYYPNHRRSSTERPLPVLRVDFDDADEHRLYIDPTKGRTLLKIDNSRRVYRWLFYALHNWDFGVLYSRPLWDAWMVLWSLIGLALSVTSLYIGWRRVMISTGRSPQEKRARLEKEANARIIA